MFKEFPSTKNASSSFEFFNSSNEASGRSLARSINRNPVCTDQTAYYMWLVAYEKSTKIQFTMRRNVQHAGFNTVFIVTLYNRRRVLCLVLIPA